MKFIKSFGLGILYFFLLPFIILGSCLVAVVGVFNFAVQFVIMLVNFFKGKKLFPTFKKDEEALKILEQVYQNKVGTPQKQDQTKGATFIQQNFYASPNQAGGMPNMPGITNPQYQQVGAPQYQQYPSQDNINQLPNTAPIDAGSEEGNE